MDERTITLDNDYKRDILSSNNSNCVDFSYLFETFAYFRQRQLIQNVLNNNICEWLSNDKDLNAHKLKFCIFFFKQLLLEKICRFLNLLDIKIIELHIGKNNETTDVSGKVDVEIVNRSFCDKYTQADCIQTRYTIALLCTSEYILIVFEDGQRIHLNQGNIIVFNSDIRYIIANNGDCGSPGYISFKFLGFAEPELSDWWLRDKELDKSFNFSITDC